MLLLIKYFVLNYSTAFNFINLKIIIKFTIIITAIIIIIMEVSSLNYFKVQFIEFS